MFRASLSIYWAAAGQVPWNLTHRARDGRAASRVTAFQLVSALPTTSPHRLQAQLPGVIGHGKHVFQTQSKAFPVLHGPINSFGTRVLAVTTDNRQSLRSSVLSSEEVSVSSLVSFHRQVK